MRAANGGSYAATIPPAAIAASSISEGDVMAALGLDVWLGLPTVGKTVAGGAGARAGLRPATWCWRVDGKPFAHAADFVQAVRAAPGRSRAAAGARGSATARTDVACR